MTTRCGISHSLHTDIVETTNAETLALLLCVHTHGSRPVTHPPCARHRRSGDWLAYVLTPHFELRPIALDPRDLPDPLDDATDLGPDPEDRP